MTDASPVDTLSVSAGSGYSKRTSRPATYVHTDFSTGELVELTLVPLTETFTVDVAVAPLATPNITLDIAINCTLRLLMATSFLPGLRLLGAEFHIPSLSHGSDAYQTSSIELTVSPITTYPIAFPALFRSRHSSWFIGHTTPQQQTLARPRLSVASIPSGSWNPTRHHRSTDEWDVDITRPESACSSFAMPMSSSEYRRVGARTERWTLHARRTAAARETPVSWHSQQNSAEPNQKDSDELPNNAIRVYDLRQIPFFLLPSNRDNTRWLINNSCHELIYRIDIEHTHQHSGSLKPGTEALLRNFSSSSILVLHVPDFPTANRQLHIHMLRYLPVQLDMHAQLVIKEDASKGRQFISIGCPLRVRSSLSRPVEIIFLAEANATSVRLKVVRSIYIYFTHSGLAM